MPKEFCACEEPLFDERGNCYECGGVEESAVLALEREDACRD